MRKWEYKTAGMAGDPILWAFDGHADPTYNGRSETSVLNELGSDGWELAAAYPPVTTGVGGPFTRYVFKRPVE